MSDSGKWIKDTARLFYQIFSVDYEDAAFMNKLLAGGGGNSSLCSTWTHLNSSFIKERISKNAYTLLLTKLNEEEKELVCFDENTVYIAKRVFTRHKQWFANNAKGAENREKAEKFFHFDHNPSNKKVLALLNKKIKEHKDEEDFLEELAQYIEKVQSLDLITIYEDDIRTKADSDSLNGPLSSRKRDDLLKVTFYDMQKVNAKFLKEKRKNKKSTNSLKKHKP